MKKMSKNSVSSETGRLRKLLIHSPDGGIGKIIPSKFKDWLYDDTVDLAKMQREYDEYLLVLLYFLDPKKAKQVHSAVKASEGKSKRPAILKPDKKKYFNSDRVVDVQRALADILKNKRIKNSLVSAVCAIENCDYKTQLKLMNIKPKILAKVLITGVRSKKKSKKGEKEKLTFIFPPVPNLVFTRDIGIMVKDHLLLSKPAKLARRRESFIAKYIALFHNSFGNRDRKQQKIIEIVEDSKFFLADEKAQKEQVISIEGGDLMMIAPHHLIIGCSERTSQEAVNRIIQILFDKKKLGITTISVVKVPEARSQMHIDTIFTQVGKDTWVLFGKFSEELQNEENNKRFFTKAFAEANEEKEEYSTQVYQFFDRKTDTGEYFSQRLRGIEQLLRKISHEDFGVAKQDVKIIYSGNNEFPSDEREQWTDSCNLLALKDNVVIGYNRNHKTSEAFRKAGFEIIKATELIEKFRNGLKPKAINKTLITLSSAELSRARGGSHCMSMPLLRDETE